MLPPPRAAPPVLPPCRSDTSCAGLGRAPAHAARPPLPALPCPPPHSQSGNVAEYYNKGSLWDNSPSCPTAPSWSTARADSYGRLWGWDDKAGSSCAFKGASGQAVYPPKTRR